MNCLRLLAKSSKTPDAPRRSETLPGHLEDVGRVAQALIRAHGRRWLTTLGCAADEWLHQFEAAAVRGGLLHDLGKANDQFQAMVRGQRTAPQAFRHEILTLWLLARQPELLAWLFSGCSPLVKHAALAAVVGHHLQFEDGKRLQPRSGSGALAVDLFWGHEDFRSALAAIGGVAGVNQPPPSLADARVRLTDRPVLPGLQDWLDEIEDWWESASDAERRLLAAVKAVVIAADVAGSGRAAARRRPDDMGRSAAAATLHSERSARRGATSGF